MTYKHANSASRLHSTVTVLSIAPNDMLLNCWKRVFKMGQDKRSGTSPHPDEAVLMPLLSVQAEIRCLARAAEKQGVSKVLYVECIAHLQALSSPLNLRNSASSYGQLDKLLLSLAFMVELLPEDQQLLDHTVLGDVIQAINDLELQLQDLSMPDGLQELLRVHLDLFRHAVLTYPIAGAKALRDAQRGWIAATLVAEQVAKDESSSAGMQASLKAFDAVGTAVDLLLKADGAYQLASRVVNFLLDQK